MEEILPAEVKEHMDMLNKKFMKIEFDPLLTKVEKQPHMVEWWSTAHSRMIEGMVVTIPNITTLYIYCILIYIHIRITYTV